MHKIKLIKIHDVYAQNSYSYDDNIKQCVSETDFCEVSDEDFELLSNDESTAYLYSQNIVLIEDVTHSIHDIKPDIKFYIDKIKKKTVENQKKEVERQTKRKQAAEKRLAKKKLKEIEKAKKILEINGLTITDKQSIQ